METIAVFFGWILLIVIICCAAALATAGTTWLVFKLVESITDIDLWDDVIVKWWKGKEKPEEDV